MSEDKKHETLTIRILGRDYPVACPNDEREALLSSAEHLSRRMQSIQKKGKALGSDRVAVMAALNTTHELLTLQREVAQMRKEQAPGDEQSLVPDAQSSQNAPQSDAYEARLAKLQQRIESALEDPSDTT